MAKTAIGFALHSGDDWAILWEIRQLNNDEVKMQQHPKMRPPQANESSTTVFIMVGVLIGIIFILIGMVAATRDDVEISPSPTFVPAPRLADGSPLGLGDTLYVVEDSAFSFIAAVDNENINQPIAACTPVIVQSSSNGYYFDLDFTQQPEAYWVYASVTSEDESGWNGWLPFSVLSQTKPESCPE